VQRRGGQGRFHGTKVALTCWIRVAVPLGRRLWKEWVADKGLGLFWLGRGADLRCGGLQRVSFREARVSCWPFGFGAPGSGGIEILRSEIILFGR
jgi:hypothetical protein